MSDPKTSWTQEKYEPKPLPAEDWPSLENIQTEDGAPVDGVFSEKQMRLLTGTLYSSWKTDKTFVALANVGLFYATDTAPIVPDVLLSINVRMPENLFPKINRSYFVWKYGKPPEVVIEIVSNRDGGEDTRKLDIYSDIRVSNYVIYDPERHLSDEPLRLFQLLQDRLIPCPALPCSFPSIGLGLTIWNGQFEYTDSLWLRWTTLDGLLIPTGEELALQEKQRADVAEQNTALERQRVEAERQRVEAERQRAEAEKQRADELARETERLYRLLREKGIEDR